MHSASMYKKEQWVDISVRFLLLGGERGLIIKEVEKILIGKKKRGCTIAIGEEMGKKRGGVEENPRSHKE